MTVEEREQRWAEAMRAERRGEAVAYERMLKEVATALRRSLAPCLWISHQLTEAYGWKVAPRYIIRDRSTLPWIRVLGRLQIRPLMLRPHQRL